MILFMRPRFEDYIVRIQGISKKTIWKRNRR